MWLDRVKHHYGDELEINWRSFVLEQKNAGDKEEGWKIWEEPEDYPARSLLSLRAGEAARRQGEEAFHRFHLALLKARHGGGERVPLNEVEPIVAVAREAGLDVGQFQEDLKDRDLLVTIGADHTEATEQHGVFGTPTFVFENGNAMFLKTFVPPVEDSVGLFEHFVAISRDRSYVGEIKRPQPPWPTGAVR